MLVKKLLFLILLVPSLTVMGQSIYFTKTGHIWFFSGTPIEDIEAHNNKTTAAIDIKNNIVEFKLRMSDFKFEKSLMQEHFNENYVESDIYPFALFKGSFSNFSALDFTQEGFQNAQVKGIMTIHGEEQMIEAKGQVSLTDKQLIISATFPLEPKHYNIKIPRLLIKNIAEIIEVHVEVSLNELKPK